MPQSLTVNCFPNPQELRLSHPWTAPGVMACLVALVTMIAIDSGAAEVRSSFEAFNAYCVGPVGADTVDVWTRDDERLQVRLIGVDAEVLEESYPRYAEAVLSDMIDGKLARVEVYERYSESEILGRVIIDHRDLSFTLISEGLVRYDGNAPAALRLYLAEDQAIRSRRGFWAQAVREYHQRQALAGYRLALSNIAWRLDQKRTPLPPLLGAEHYDEAISMRIGDWVGSSSEVLIAGWGEPDRIVWDGAGGKILYYERSLPDGVSSNSEMAVVRFFVDGNGVITARDWEEMEGS